MNLLLWQLIQSPLCIMRALMNKLVIFKDALHGNLDTAIDLENRLVNIPSNLRIQ